MEKKVDLCIVGAAGSGMTAAIYAAQKGVKNIVVLEKMKRPGGCTTMSCGMMALNSPVQKRFGLYYSVDDAFRKLMSVNNWNCNAMMVRKWLNGSGENIAWLETLGFKYDYVCTEVADYSKFPKTTHRIGTWDGNRWLYKLQGPLLAKCLTENCAKHGIEILTKTRAVRLLQDKRGAVVGVEANGPGGTTKVHADAVILCTGSISSNQELIKRYYGSDEYKDVRIMAKVPHNTGDGHLMAQEIGAAFGRIGTLFIGPHNHYPGASEVTGMIMRRPHYMLVNIYGERFADESIPIENEFGWMMGLALDNQPGKVCYALIDQDGIEDLMAGKEYLPPRDENSSMIDRPADMGGIIEPDKGKDPAKWRERIIDHIEYEEKKGRAKICRTIEEIAGYIGCEAEALKASIEKYNLSCIRKYDVDFLKNSKYLTPFQRPPYYVLLGRSGIDTCLGGLKVDHYQRVLKYDGGIIPGLYAAGVMCSGWFNNAYSFFGSEMSYTVYSGRAAGSEASAYIK